MVVGEDVPPGGVHDNARTVALSAPRLDTGGARTGRSDADGGNGDDAGTARFEDRGQTELAAPRCINRNAGRERTTLSDDDTQKHDRARGERA